MNVLHWLLLLVLLSSNPSGPRISINEIGDDDGLYEMSEDIEVVATYPSTLPPFITYVQIAVLNAHGQPIYWRTWWGSNGTHQILWSPTAPGDYSIAVYWTANGVQYTTPAGPFQVLP